MTHALRNEDLWVLTHVERDLLKVLSEGRSCSSVVRLCADIWGRDGTDDRLMYGDPIGFATLILEGLNEHGFVTYKVHDDARAEDTPVGFAGLPYDIRLTPKGWTVLGYKHVFSEVGYTPRLREVSTLDRTDYRNHRIFAEGGPCTTHLWWQCPILFPSPKPKEVPMADVLVIAVPEGKPRSYVKVTPEMEERVINSYARTGSYEKTAAETNLDQRRVRYIVNDRPRLQRDSSSLKERVLTTIQEQGPFVDLMSLHRAMPGSHGLHNLVHILHSLHKAQLIDFREAPKKGTNNGGQYLNIRARETKPSGADPSVTELRISVDGTSMSTDMEVDGTDTPEGEVSTAEVALTSEAVGLTNGADPQADVQFPLLSSLLRVQKETEEGRTKASRYIAAAENIADMDPDMAEHLMQKAADIDGPMLSPVEQEYLRYAETHP